MEETIILLYLMGALCALFLLGWCVMTGAIAAYAWCKGADVRATIKPYLDEWRAPDERTRL